ncbi:unnamed protein product [Anisakis simplex]|uniref:MATH domain-containing protein n=1 Tax=Anisakis simplex TaxID=6269 RepID=A0A0M3JP51_ANISI|nr:unnamed protein product [Anisakis simplex]
MSDEASEGDQMRAATSDHDSNSSEKGSGDDFIWDFYVASNCVENLT